MQLCNLAQRGADDHARIGAGGPRFCELRLRLGGAACERGIDRGVGARVGGRCRGEPEFAGEGPVSPGVFMTPETEKTRDSSRSLTR